MTQPVVPVVRQQRICGWPKHPEGGRAGPFVLSDALTKPFATDAHFAAYASTPVERRLTHEVLEQPEALAQVGGSVLMQLAVFDVDCVESHKALGGDGEAPAPDAWWLDEQEKLGALLGEHPGLFVYRTRGGYRIVGVLEQATCLTSKEHATRWTAAYLSWVAYLRRRFQIVADPGCKDWQRLFRLPRATREEGGRPEHRETIGTAEAIGIWRCELSAEDIAAGAELSKKPERLRAVRESPINGNTHVGRGVLHTLFRERGWLGSEIEPGKWSVRCPKYAEHGKQGHDPFDTSTILYEPDTGEELGYLHCSHSNCRHDTFQLKDWVACFDQSELDRAREQLGIQRQLIGKQPRTWDPDDYADLADQCDECTATDEDRAREFDLSVPEDVLSDSDHAHAIRLLNNFGADLKHADALGWLAWDGRHWENQTKTAPRVARCLHEIGKAFTRRLNALREEISILERKIGAGGSTDEDREKLIDLKGAAKAARLHASRFLNAPSISCILTVACTLDGIACGAEIFDTDPMLLNVADGTIDLRTGERLPHSQLNYITKIIDVPYDQEALCPRWERFLEQVFVGADGVPDRALIGWLQKWFGYCLTGSSDEQCFVIFYGGGANGKSTLLETIRWILGQYAANSPTDTFLETKGSRGPENDLARLRGVRMVTAVETKEDRKLDEQRAKQMTGKDAVTARFLFKEYFDFHFTAKINLATNHKPRIDGTDHAIWRRIKLVPMLRTFAREEQQTDLDEVLKREAPGILCWLVEGARTWQREGLLPLPDAISQANAEYQHESNPVARFVAECCATGAVESYRQKLAEVVTAYNIFASAIGKQELSAGPLAKKLGALGFGSETRGNKKTRWILGLMLRSEEPGGDED